MSGVLVRTSSRPPFALAELWHFRELLRSLVVRNLRVKYQRSALGFVWTLLNPLLTVAVLVTVFSVFLRIPIPRYWAFLVSGYFAWNFFLQMVNMSTWVLAEHTSLRRSVAFPPEVLVLAASLARMVELTVELSLALLALALLHHHGTPESWILLPVLLLLLWLVTLGLSFPVATLAAFYSDVQHALPIGLLMLFYLSPVFYSAAQVPEAVRPFYFLNPMAGVLTLFQQVLYGGDWPGSRLLLGTAAGAVFLVVAGYASFHRCKAVFAELV
ncbi:MAG TPA: ABC transporter permease [Candidatus Polarisedimenticolaceae bacterium]|nr:ABC transporter permease [Candidatus Polarisedimenticolaceae bacterium]